MVRLLAHPLPPSPSAICLSFSVFLNVTGRAYCREMAAGKGVGEEPNHTTARKPGPLHKSVLSGSPTLFVGKSGKLSEAESTWKRKFVEEKTTTKLKSKQTSIAMVRNHLQTLASLPTPPPFSLHTTFNPIPGSTLSSSQGPWIWPLIDPGNLILATKVCWPKYISHT